MAFNIDFDFRFASDDFFTDAVRGVLDAAAGVWEGLIDDEFADVPAGSSFSVRDPGAADGRTDVTLDRPIDDLRIFVGAHQPPFGIGDSDTRTLARALVDGGDITGDVYDARTSGNFRGAGPVTDFEPFAGTISINPAPDWGIDDDGPVPGKLDLFSTVLHEIGHVLGLGASATFDAKTGSDGFDGANARRANDGEPIPLTANGAHTEGTVESLMAPRLAIGQRNLPTELDRAMLADIGYEIDGFDAAGATPSIVTGGDDRLVTGRAVADTLNGMAGADRLQGKAGDDRLTGGTGDDTLMGQAGADTLAGGAGNDLLTGGAGRDVLAGDAGDDRLFGGDGADTLIAGRGADSLTGDAGADIFVVPEDAGRTRLADFDPGRDSLRIDPAFGLPSPEAVLARASADADGEMTIPLAPEATVVVDAEPAGLADAVAVGGVTGTGGDDGAAPDPTLAARPDTIAVAPGRTVTVDPIANDAGSDGARVTAVSAPVIGNTTITDDGEIRFTAPAALAADVSFSYGVSDGAGPMDAATVTVALDDRAPDGASTPALTELAPEVQLTSLYLGLFDRLPDPGGLAFWADQLTRATDMGVPGETVLANIAESFRMSPEGRDRLPTLDSATPSADAVGEFVTRFHASVFGREPDAAERAHWRQRIADDLRDGAPLGDVVVDMLTPPVPAENGDTMALYHRLEVARTAVQADASDDASAATVLAGVDADRDSVDTALLGIGGISDKIGDPMIG